MHAITNSRPQPKIKVYLAVIITAQQRWRKIHFHHMTNSSSFFLFVFFIIDYPQAAATARSCSSETHGHTADASLLLWLVSMKCLHLSPLYVCLIDLQSESRDTFMAWYHNHYPFFFLSQGSMDSSYKHHTLEYKWKDYIEQLIRGRALRHVRVC